MPLPTEPNAAACLHKYTMTRQKGWQIPVPHVIICCYWINRPGRRGDNDKGAQRVTRQVHFPSWILSSDNGRQNCDGVPCQATCAREVEQGFHRLDPWRQFFSLGYGDLFFLHTFLHNACLSACFHLFAFQVSILCVTFVGLWSSVSMFFLIY